jgi:hypothetical protein
METLSVEVLFGVIVQFRSEGRVIEFGPEARLTALNLKYPQIYCGAFGVDFKSCDSETKPIR